MKKLLLATAASGLMLSVALAQSPNPPASSPPAGSPPAATKKQDMSKPGGAMDKSSGAAAADKAASADSKVIASQTPDQLLASKFNGTDVVGSDDKKIGDVSDILFDKDGKVLAYVISVGGFLGIGSKNVALEPKAFQVIPGVNGAADKLKVSMGQEQFKQMAQFQPYQRPQPRPATTGSAGGLGRPAPAPSGGASR